MMKQPMQVLTHFQIIMSADTPLLDYQTQISFNGGIC